MDFPISRLNNATVIPVEDAPSFKDDRKAEAVSRAIFFLIGSTFRPVIAIGLEWTKWLRGERYPPGGIRSGGTDDTGVTVCLRHRTRRHSTIGVSISFHQWSSGVHCD